MVRPCVWLCVGAHRSPQGLVSPTPLRWELSLRTRPPNWAGAEAQIRPQGVPGVAAVIGKPTTEWGMCPKTDVLVFWEP